MYATAAPDVHKLQSWNAAFFLFFFVGYSLGGGGGISGRVGFGL